MKETTDQQRKAAYVFGFVFVAFLMIVFFFGDPDTPLWKQQIVAFLGALLAALTTVFLVGSTYVEGDLGPGLKVQATGGVGVFIVVFVVWMLAIDRTPDDKDTGRANRPPVAVTGPAQVEDHAGLVQLDGKDSYDLDGDPMTYQWTLAVPDGSRAELSAPRAERPTFVRDVPGRYTATLVVSDGALDSAPAETTTEWPQGPPADTNTPPIAEAGLDQEVALGGTVRLDGGGSRDEDSDPLTYSWSLSAPSASRARLATPDARLTSFRTDVIGAYEATLVVSDGHAASAPDLVLVTVLREEHSETPTPLPDRPPIADAGEDLTVQVGQAVRLDGSRSRDPDGDRVTHAWTLASRPEASATQLTGSSTPRATLVPDEPGHYRVRLVVQAGQLASEAAEVTVEALPAPAPEPVIEDRALHACTSLGASGAWLAVGEAGLMVRIDVEGVEILDAPIEDYLSASSSSDGELVLAAGKFGAVVLSTDGGATWKAVDVGDDTDLVSSLCAPDGSAAWVGGRRLLLSLDPASGRATPARDPNPADFYRCMAWVEGDCWIAGGLRPGNNYLPGLWPGPAARKDDFPYDAFQSSPDPVVRSLRYTERRQTIAFLCLYDRHDENFAIYERPRSGSWIKVDDAPHLEAGWASPDGRTLWVAGASGLHRRSAQGSWTRLATGRLRDLEGTADGTRLLAVGDAALILESTDSGATWGERRLD